MSTTTIHEKDIILDKDKLKEILDVRGLEYIEFHEKLHKKYGLHISYKGFMSLLQNRSTWKLIYAYAISDYLDVEIMDLFTVVDLDIDEEKLKKEKWKERYVKKK